MTDNQHAHTCPQRSEAKAGGPLVHPQETSEHHNISWNYRDFLTSGMQSTVDFHADVYRTIDMRDGKSRTLAYHACRTAAWFVRHRVSGKIRLASSRCNLRWCPLCIKTKRFIMLQSLVPWVRKAKKPKFITLTLKHSDAPLSHQITSLYDFFKKLRRRPYWKNRITGGIWFFQVKKSKNDHLWHPHIHILCDGRYLPHDRLSDIWCEITHGSSVVDIRAVKNPKKAAEYVARYATAPAKLDDLEKDDAVEVVDSLAGRRVCGTFGTAKGLQLVPKKCPDADEWEFLCGVGGCMAARNTSDWHKEIYSAWIEDRFCRSVSPESSPDFDTGRSLLLDEPVKYEQMVFEWSSFMKKEVV